ncbi:MAG: alpha/beta fold hydrolase, partial [Vicinamibacterales bacterium]
PTGPPILPTRFPAVVLLSDSGANDRDGYAAGVPIVGQLAGAMADAGFLSVRYDKRGTGQSGGRAESATLSDFADDASVVVKWLQARKDVDPKRIAVLGHGEGAWVALLAAGRDNRIAAVVALAAPSTTGAELVLEQQLSTLDRLNVSPGERQEKIALQKKIHSAVVSGTGWEGVPPEMRRQADTPWFQSLLAFDPAKVIRNVRQPMLFLHGQIDRQIPVEHVERIANLARTTSKSKSVEVVTVRGANHLLVPAVTGEAAEYGTLPSRNVSPDVTTAITGWLSKTSQTIK